jgi:hypothetical protein
VLAGSLPVEAQNSEIWSGFNGAWRINEELSSDTDKQVEIAIREAGGRPPRTAKKGKGRYRGGPPEHAIYDHISYDDNLLFNYIQPEFRLSYDQSFERVFHSDNRKRVISASGSVAGDNQDFSFASWDGNTLLVESRPRDGGWTLERYELLNDGLQLKATLQLKPSSFAIPINITRVYEKVLNSTDPAYNGDPVIPD